MSQLCVRGEQAEHERAAPVAWCQLDHVNKRDLGMQGLSF